MTTTTQRILHFQQQFTSNSIILLATWNNFRFYSEAFHNWATAVYFLATLGQPRTTRFSPFLLSRQKFKSVLFWSTTMTKRTNYTVLLSGS